MKKLLRCPACHDPVGELDENGNLIVLRYGSDKRRATMIVSPRMAVVCTKCNEIVFYRKSK